MGRSVPSTTPRARVVLRQQPQGVPYGDERSCAFFSGPLYATPRTIAAYGASILIRCWVFLQEQAVATGGLHSFQVFVDDAYPECRLAFADGGPDSTVIATFVEERLPYDPEDGCQLLTARSC